LIKLKSLSNELCSLTCIPVAMAMVNVGRCCFVQIYVSQHIVGGNFVVSLCSTLIIKGKRK